jgi:hypothetical protein
MSLDKAFYNYLLNPVMRRLLKSPLHRLASGNIAVLHFRGRRSGRALDTPLSYARDGDVVRLLSSQNTRWWKNFRGGPQPVEIDIAGERHQGEATLYEGDSEALRDGVARFIAAVPRDALVYGLKLDRHKRPTEPSLAANAHRLVLVEVTLTTP